MTSVELLQEKALTIREHILMMATGPEGAHVGGSLSIVEILTTLYFAVMRMQPENPRWQERDFFILSKGHASVALYATLVERGFFPREDLLHYGKFGQQLAGHPLGSVPGVEFPTGSLGHGLSLGVGKALAAQRDGQSNRTFVVLGDGELQEGSIWEAAMSAAHFKLANLTAIIDRNGLQINGPTEERIGLEPLAAKWRSFGWAVVELDGHDLPALIEVLNHLPLESERPSLIIARTKKGQGVRFMTNQKKSHHVVLSPSLYKKALTELHTV
jgi:transketolase